MKHICTATVPLYSLHNKPAQTDVKDDKTLQLAALFTHRESLVLFTVTNKSSLAFQYLLEL